VWVCEVEKAIRYSSQVLLGRSRSIRAGPPGAATDLSGKLGACAPSSRSTTRPWDCWLWVAGIGVVGLIPSILLHPCSHYNVLVSSWILLLRRFIGIWPFRPDVHVCIVYLTKCAYRDGWMARQRPLDLPLLGLRPGTWPWWQSEDFLSSLNMGLVNL
jgi:hypothetical protein